MIILSEGHIVIMQEGNYFMMSRGKYWYEVWQKKYNVGNYDSIHMVDGFDLLSLRQWKTLTSYFLDKLNISENDDVLEIGCGGGAWLGQIHKCRNLSGIDYSENAIKLIRKRLHGNFCVADALQLPFPDNHFNYVLSWSVFFYFDSLDYAKHVVKEMVRVVKPKGIIFIGDINDIDKKDIAIELRNDSESFRRKTHVSREPVDHLYYSKCLFQEIAKEYNMKISFYDEDVDELNFYHSAKYRYSVVMENVQSMLDYD